MLGHLPLVYPFIVNDPGEGTQAKRRGHATIIDHLIPPMARADSYGDLARLEQLLDEYATVSALDPAKLPVLRTQIWELIQAAELHHDLELASAPGEAEFDSFVLHVDGYLCEVKDALIRDGLHILGRAPDGEQRVSTVLAVLRAAQVWGGRTAALPGLRSALAGWAGLDEEILRNENPGGPVTVPAALTRVAEGPARTAGGRRRPAGVGRAPARRPPWTISAGPRARRRWCAPRSWARPRRTWSASWSSRPARWCPGWPGPPTR